jgi:hypothetical protein
VSTISLFTSTLEASISGVLMLRWKVHVVEGLKGPQLLLTLEGNLALLEGEPTLYSLSGGIAACTYRDQY